MDEQTNPTGDNGAEQTTPETPSEGQGGEDSSM